VGAGPMLTGFFVLKIWILEKRSILRFSSGNPKPNEILADRKLRT
jgi:hypothetical protein